MKAAPLQLSPQDARRLHRSLVLLDAPAGNVSTALAHHAYIQIDPINVCGRMHDLILRNRVDHYREGDLMRLLHGTERPLDAERRTAFEHHLPNTGILVAFGLEAWPHLQAAMRGRTRTSSAWSGRLTPKERELAKEILARLEAGSGPLKPEDFEKRPKARSIWGSASLAKSALQKMFFHGQLLIAQRDGSRRLYDLPRNVLPAAVLNRPEASPEETARWLALVKLRQRRICTLTKAEYPHVADLVQPLGVPGCRPLYCLREDLAALDVADSGMNSAQRTPPSSPAQLLAPLDPLIYDRELTRSLWGFDYTWEVYVPESRRVRGYYALPVLVGTELVGHVEPRADRVKAKLEVLSRSIGGRHKTTAAVEGLADFLGMRR